MPRSPNVTPLSPSSASSFDMISSAIDMSDEEIVWSPQASSSGESSSQSGISDSESEDFVLLDRPICAPALLRNAQVNTLAEREISAALARLSVGSSLTQIQRPSSAATVKKATVIKTTTSLPTVASPDEEKAKHRKAKAERKARRKAKRKAEGKAKAASNSTIGSSLTPISKSIAMSNFPIVDDTASEFSDDSDVSTVSSYDKANSILSSFIAQPDTRDRISKLSILHALIIEFGVGSASSALPSSLAAAKTLLKSQVHVNIREYMATREQGQDALKKIMHPSQGALVKSIRKKKNPASLEWVKKQGLNVLLVTCFR